MNAAYHYLDLTRWDATKRTCPIPMDWVRLRDQYQPPQPLLPELIDPDRARLCGGPAVCSPSMERSMASSIVGSR